MEGHKSFGPAVNQMTIPPKSSPWSSHCTVLRVMIISPQPHTPEDKGGTFL
jgi:hypothetical protein